MDSRIEELAEIIVERTEDFIKNCPNVYQGESVKQKYKSYKLIGCMAVEILEIIHQYRIDNPDLY